MSEDEVRLEGPPPRFGATHPPRYPHDEIVRTAKENPGEWVNFTVGGGRNNHTSLANSMRAGRYVQYRPAADWEIAPRKVGDENRIYVRFIGEK